jgi:hypothetical protein
MQSPQAQKSSLMMIKRKEKYNIDYKVFQQTLRDLDVRGQLNFKQYFMIFSWVVV